MNTKQAKPCPPCPRCGTESEITKSQAYANDPRVGIRCMGLCELESPLFHNRDSAIEWWLKPFHHHAFDNGLDKPCSNGCGAWAHEVNFQVAHPDTPPTDVAQVPSETDLPPNRQSEWTRLHNTLHQACSLFGIERSDGAEVSHQWMLNKLVEKFARSPDPQHEPDLSDTIEWRADGVVQEIVLGNGEVVALGIPADEDEDSMETKHNCDFMGCGQAHVLWRHDYHPARSLDPQWVAVSERLPESDGYYLVTYESEAGTPYVVSSFFNRAQFEIPHTNYAYDAIAWQPLPSPYKPNEEDK